MSDYSHNKGIIYPLPKMTEEERDKLDFSLKAPFSYEAFEGRNNNINRYLFFSLYHTYGQRSDNFGSSRKCTAKEIAQYAPMFAEVLVKEIDNAQMEIIFNNIGELSIFYIPYIKLKALDPITVGEFNTLLDIVKLEKFKINE